MEIKFGEINTKRGRFLPQL